MKKVIISISLITWAVVGSYLLTKVHSWHFANLQDVSTLKVASVEASKWGVYHFFDARCGCSKSIIDNLLKREPMGGKMVEKIFYHGELGKYQKKLTAKGYLLSEKNFESMGVTGVPLLVIFDQEKKVRYAGGYSKRSINPLAPPNELKLIAQVQRGEDITSMPVIGCSVSKEYQKLLDPLGLKYDRAIN